jgi:HSP20 family protein
MARKAKQKIEKSIEQPVETTPEQETEIPTETVKEEVVETKSKVPIEEESQAPKSPDMFEQKGELVVDVFETDSHFVVVSAIAGVQIKDLDISVEKDMMVIKGTRPDPHENPERNYFYQECYWGPFSRKIVLPENVHTEQASAQMDKGMLTIKIPKVGGVNKKESMELS